MNIEREDNRTRFQRFFDTHCGIIPLSVSVISGAAAVLLIFS